MRLVEDDRWSGQDFHPRGRLGDAHGLAQDVVPEQVGRGGGFEEGVGGLLRDVPEVEQGTDGGPLDSADVDLARVDREADAEPEIEVGVGGRWRGGNGP